MRNDLERLEQEVKSVYEDVAREPDEEEFHFETGRSLAERLGYPPAELNRVPSAAIDSFAGVGYHFDLADLEAGDDVLDLGSGSGTDAFLARLHVGDDGTVTGLDMTEEQLEKARLLRNVSGIDGVSFERGYVEDLPFADESFDVVLSNGVVSLSAEKARVFEEAHRVLGPFGRLALADVVSDRPLPDGFRTDADLWAASIAGAVPIDEYTTMIEAAGFDVLDVQENPSYEFASPQARGACRRYGVKSVSIGARKGR